MKRRTLGNNPEKDRQLMVSPVVRVQLCANFASGYDYLCPAGEVLRVGEYVRVPFGKRQLVGVVWETDIRSQVDPGKLREVGERLGMGMGVAQRRFLELVANRNLASLGAVLKMALPFADILRAPKATGYLATDSGGADQSLRIGKKAKQALDLLASRATPLARSDLQAAGIGTAVLSRLEQKGLVKKVVLEAKPAVSEDIVPSSVILSPEQAQAHEQILQHFACCRKVFLHGATGSGKTEICYQIARDLVRQGKQVLLLMPEIALATEAARRIKERVGSARVIEWHSGISAAKKRTGWQQVASGKPSVIVGARSALFLPFSKLGLVMVEEEHDRSFKQESGVLYQARDVAADLAELSECPLLLISATPSLETVYKIQCSEYQLVKLPPRNRDTHGLAEIKIVDMSACRLPAGTWLSPSLQEALLSNWQAGQQSLLFLNRRGYAPLIFCRSCGHKFKCPRCSCCLVSHCRPTGRTDLLCHCCGKCLPLPKHCPRCQQNDFCFWGPGCERLAEEVSQLFPTMRVLVLSSDKMRTVASAKAKLDLIRQGKVDVVIGTQVLAKGHNFPHLTLVGLVDTDTGQQGADLRGYERIYQLLTQVAGRAGRFHLPSKVLLQTYAPDDPFIQQIARRDLAAFLSAELKVRQQTGMPPFTRLVALILKSRREDYLRQCCAQLHRHRPLDEQVKIWGPAPAPISKIKEHYRWRYLICSGHHYPIQDFLRTWLDSAEVKNFRHVTCQVDVDPYSFS